MNLGNPGEFTILELADMVIEMTGSKSELVKKPLPAGRSREAKTRYHDRVGKVGWGSLEER